MNYKMDVYMCVCKDILTATIKYCTSGYCIFDVKLELYIMKMK